MAPEQRPVDPGPPHHDQRHEYDNPSGAKVPVPPETRDDACQSPERRGRPVVTIFAPQWIPEPIPVFAPEAVAPGHLPQSQGAPDQPQRHGPDQGIADLIRCQAAEVDVIGRARERDSRYPPHTPPADRPRQQKGRHHRQCARDDRRHPPARHRRAEDPHPDAIDQERHRGHRIPTGRKRVAQWPRHEIERRCQLRTLIATQVRRRPADGDAAQEAGPDHEGHQPPTLGLRQAHSPATRGRAAGRRATGRTRKRP